MGMAKLKKCVLMGGLKSVRSVKMENAGKLESVKGLKELMEEERKRKEEEEWKRMEEERRRKEEEERKRMEEERKRKEEERKRKEEEERKRKEEERRRKEEEERKRREEEERKRREEERKRMEEERKRKEEEERKRREEERKRREEEQRKRVEEEWKRMEEEERKRMEEEEKRRIEERRRREEEERKKKEQRTGIPLINWLLKRKEEEERKKKELQSNMEMFNSLLKRAEEEEKKERKKVEEQMSNLAAITRLLNGGEEEAMKQDDWSHFAMTETRINTASDLNRAYCYMDAMIIEPHCCNEGELIVLDLSRFVFLRELRVGDECFENVNEVKLIGLKKLEKVVIGKNCFTRYKNGSGLNPNRRFSLMDCEMLTELKIGCYSFSDYYTCKIENVPSLEVIEMGALNESSSVFFYASLELKSVDERVN